MSLFYLIFPLLFVWWVVSGVHLAMRPRAVWQAQQQRRARRRSGGPGAGEAESDQAAAAPTPQHLARLRRRGIYSILLGVAGWWLAGYSLAWSAEPNVWRSESNAAEIEKIVLPGAKKYLQEQDGIGLAVVAVVDDQTCLLGIGGRSLTDTRAPDGNTQFEIGSITKTFTGLLLARLIEQQRAALDQPVQQLLPDGYQLPEAARDTVTLKHLATHTSGFPRLPANFLGPANILRIAAGGDPYGAYTEQQFREAVNSVTLADPPGTKASYSNFGAGLLGFALAQPWQGDYGAAIEQQILKPLEMQHTGLNLASQSPTVGYRNTRRLGPLLIGQASSPWTLPSHLAGAGGIRSTPSDMLRYLEANMARRDTPLAAAIKRAHEPLHKDSEQREYGLFWLRQRDAEGRTILWHNGGTGGYRSYLGFTDDHRFGVVLLANSQLNTDKLGIQILADLRKQFTQ